MPVISPIGEPKPVISGVPGVTATPSITGSLLSSPTGATTTASNSGFTSVVLTVGLEFGMLGLMTAMAASSEEIGKVLVVLMIGFAVLFVMYHAAITQAIPNLFSLVQQGKI